MAREKHPFQEIPTKEFEQTVDDILTGFTDTQSAIEAAPVGEKTKKAAQDRLKKARTLDAQAARAGVIVTTEDPTGAILLEEYPEDELEILGDVEEAEEPIILEDELEEPIILEDEPPAARPALEDFELDEGALEDVEADFGLEKGEELTTPTADPFAPTDVSPATPAIEKPKAPELSRKEKDAVISALKIPEDIAQEAEAALTETYSSPEGFKIFFVEELNKILDKRMSDIKDAVHTAIKKADFGVLSSDDKAALLDYFNRANLVDIPLPPKIKNDSTLKLYVYEMQEPIAQYRKFFSYKR